MLVASLSLALCAQVPFTLPPGFGKTLGEKAASFGPTITVVVNNVPRPPPLPVPAATDIEVGLKIYRQRCVLCHGDAGRGDGIGARRIEPEPQHLNDVIWQASVSDEEIKNAIILGGAAVSRSPMMPANPDLNRKPDVVRALVSYVRSLRARFGSALGSMQFADNSSVAVHADANAKGRAVLVFSNVPKGAATITVLVDGEGKVGCTLHLVADKDLTVPCQ